MNRTAFPAFPALAGVLAVASGAAVAELVAALIGRPQAGTVVVVGSVLVDAAPTPVKEFAVATLGTADKPVLLGGIGVVLAVLAAGLGIVACRNRAAGSAGAVVLGLVGTAAALTRPAAQIVDALPSLVGMLVIAGALLLLLRALRPVVTERTPRSVGLTYPTPRSLTETRDDEHDEGRASAWTGAPSSVPPHSSPPVPRRPAEAPPCSAGRRAPPRSVNRCACPRRPSPHRRCLPGSIRAS